MINFLCRDHNNISIHGECRFQLRRRSSRSANVRLSVSKSKPQGHIVMQGTFRLCAFLRVEIGMHKDRTLQYDFINHYESFLFLFRSNTTFDFLSKEKILISIN